MSERKVLNKYYPPDFDHTKLQKVVRPRDKQDNVRMMLPMSVRCETCGNFLYEGTKFNMRKETCLDQDYLGIKIYRFYFKCSRCHAEIAMKTDPKQHDYVCESGASRNYDPLRDMGHAEKIMKARSQLEDESDAMKRVERKGFNSKREMELMDSLNEVKLLNKRLAKVDHDELLKQTIRRQDDIQRAIEDETLTQASRQSASKAIPATMTDEELKERFLERQRNWRLEDFEDDNFDELIEIEDPFAIFKDAQKPDSDNDDSDDNQAEVLARPAAKGFARILGKRKRPDLLVTGLSAQAGAATVQQGSKKPKLAVVAEKPKPLPLANYASSGSESSSDNEDNGESVVDNSKKCPSQM